jgi:hypothetical protein
MTVGKAAATANSYLNVFRNTAYSAIAQVFVQLHVGDPGAAGTANVSALTTRNEVTWNAPAGGSMTLNTLASFSMTASETISHVSLWTAAAAGTFLQSAALTAAVPVVNGSTLTFSAFTLGFTPIAA